MSARRAGRASSGSTRRPDAKCGARARNGDRATRRRCRLSSTGSGGCSCLPAASPSPPTGGLMSIDPANGTVDFSFPWRSRSVRVGQRVVSGRLRQQGVRLGELSHRRRAARDRPDFTHRVVWTTQEFGLHFNTPIYKDGYLYGFDGRNEPDASLACVDAASGKVVWRETPEWTETFRPAARQRATARHLSRVAARRRRTVSVPRRDGTPAVDGSDAEGLQGDLARLAVRRRASRGRCRC